MLLPGAAFIHPFQGNPKATKKTVFFTLLGSSIELMVPMAMMSEGFIILKPYFFHVTEVFKLFLDLVVKFYTFRKKPRVDGANGDDV